MKDPWENELACAAACHRCDTPLDRKEVRILSVYDHQPICLVCKREEERRPDYEQVSKTMLETCMRETELMFGDPGGYCYHHFYPFSCDG